MKKLVMVFAALMMLAGATVSVMKAMQIGPFSPDPDANEQVADAKPKSDLLDPPRFIDLDPLVVPIFQGDSIATTIQITVKLETTGAEKESKINKWKPRISDAFIRDLYSFIPRLLRNQERVNVFIIKKRLQLIGDKVMGPGIIENILVQSITDTPKR